jgi:hypothetical protein
VRLRAFIKLNKNDMALESLKNERFKDKILKCELNKLFGGQSTVRTASSDTKSGNCTDVATTTFRKMGQKALALLLTSLR